MVANEAASHAAASSAIFELRGARIAVAIVDIHTSIAINRSGCGHPRHSLESIGEDDSCVHPSHQTAPVRQTERGTAVAAVQFLELLHALDPSTGNLTTAQLTKDVTPRAAPAKPEHLRSRTPARPEAIPAPEGGSSITCGVGRCTCETGITRGSPAQDVGGTTLRTHHRNGSTLRAHHRNDAAASHATTLSERRTTSGAVYSGVVPWSGEVKSQDPRLL